MTEYKEGDVIWWIDIRINSNIMTDVFQNGGYCAEELTAYSLSHKVSTDINKTIDYAIEQLNLYKHPDYNTEKECQHESDGNIHAMANPGETGRLLMNKCKLCGEFYK